MSEKNKTEWSDLKRWSMDLLKNTIAFGFVAIISLNVIERIQDNRAISKAREDAFYTVRLKALDDFRYNAVQYDLSAYSAYTDIYQWKNKIKTSSMLKYERAAYPDWKLACETILQVFPNIEIYVNQYVEKNKLRHFIYDKLVDRRLDGNVETVLDPEEYREDFDMHTESMGELRLIIIAALQNELFPLSINVSASASTLGA